VPSHRPTLRSTPRARRLSLPLSRRATGRVLVVLAASAAVLAGPMATSSSSGMPASKTGSRPMARLAVATVPTPIPFDIPTRVRVSSFNLLGYGHTTAGGNHPKYTDGITRMNWAVRILHANNIQVVGFQEMQSPQYSRFRELTHAEYGIYPGNQLTTAAMANSIAWQKSRWRLVEARTVQIPYFDGNLIRMPYVLLENRQTGRQAWFFNSHNPADAHGDAQRWRNRAVAIEMALFNQLQADYPTTPIFSTGDENDRDRYFCPMVEGSQMRASNGGGVLDGTCVTPDQMRVDWVMGSSPLVQFTGSTALHTSLVQKTTDHYVIVADAVLPSEPVVDTGTTHVVVLALDGLTSRALAKAESSGQAPHLQGMVDAGASTLNARTEVESASRVANLGGILTGRPVDPALGGTGIGWPGTTRGPVSSTAGHYVASMFDVVHDYGRSTAFYSSRGDADVLASSWQATYGDTDRFGLDDGRNKIGRYVRTHSDDDTVSALVSKLAGRPATLSVVQLVRPNVVGRTFGFRSAQYAEAVGEVDRSVGRVQAAIAGNPRLNGHTLLVVTANRGGTGKKVKPTTVPAVYRVPLLVAGPGVLAGGDLYAMNPTYVRPGATQPDYASGRPIRSALVADLVTKALGLPPVRGSRLGYRQDLTVLAPPPA
jgi:hypothetical protein